MDYGKPIYNGGWQFGDTIRQQLEGPIGNGSVLYPNGDKFEGEFHLNYANIYGPCYCAHGRYTFADGAYIERAWIDTSSDLETFRLHGVFRIHHPEGHDSIAMFGTTDNVTGKYGYELVLGEKTYAIEWYAGERLREVEVSEYDIDESRQDCLALVITLGDGSRIEQRGGRYSKNQYDETYYVPATECCTRLPNGDSIDHWDSGLKGLKPYDGYMTYHAVETQRCRRERWEKGTLKEAMPWKRDGRSAWHGTLPNPLGDGELQATAWRDGHITYTHGQWEYDGPVNDDHRPEGKGVLVGKDYDTEGQRYEGEFHNGRAHGEGVFTNEKADIRQQGTFVEGVYQEANAPTSPIVLHARHGHQSWSVSSESEWKYEESDFEAKLGSLDFRGFYGCKIARIEHDVITITYYDEKYELRRGGEWHKRVSIDGDEWSDGCVYDGDNYSLDLTWNK